MQKILDWLEDLLPLSYFRTPQVDEEHRVIKPKQQYRASRPIPPKMPYNGRPHEYNPDTGDIIFDKPSWHKPSSFKPNVVDKNNATSKPQKPKPKPSKEENKNNDNENAYEAYYPPIDSPSGDYFPSYPQRENYEKLDSIFDEYEREKDNIRAKRLEEFNTKSQSIKAEAENKARENYINKMLKLGGKEQIDEIVGIGGVNDMYEEKINTDYNNVNEATENFKREKTNEAKIKYENALEKDLNSMQNALERDLRTHITGKTSSNSKKSYIKDALKDVGYTQNEIDRYFAVLGIL